ncbi:MAG: EAL domain-containing protein [Candidatus Limivicinus sp.]
MTNKKQILIVEDNELNREILSEILAGEYQILTAENGQVALEILRVHKSSVALILLDVMMPVMDGYTFLDKIKMDAELALIPVIVMTQNETEADEVNALAHGATDFVPKPYRPQVILHRVASIIKLRETAAMVNQFQYDRLTGLYSKEFFYQKVREQLEENPEKTYSIVCADIENFKLYNDTHGREAGDKLLREMAKAIRFMTGEEKLCGRYSADRFLILREREQELADRQVFFTENEGLDSSKPVNISVKWGIYEITDHDLSVEQMCDRALLAADSAKGHYNRPFAVYDDELRGKLLREKAITDVMEPALAQEQFVVYLQPMYSMKDGGMAGAEALVRWKHPEWGFMSPGEFIPLFEKNGFISRLDAYVWEKVCAKLREWRRADLPLLPVSVNVSRADIYQSNLVDTLVRLTEKYDIEPSMLHLEITESAYAEKPDQIISTVDKLRKLGFVVEMDDFGTGYSSLSMLNQMKLDYLKLDMHFVQSELAKPVEQSLLHFVIDLAHWMQLSVVAEGAETREQVDRLRNLGCDYVQGYFLARPMPVEDYEKLLVTQPLCHKEPEPQAPCGTCPQRLLVVDEDAQYREKVCQTFSDRYRVLAVPDGESALDCLAQCGSEAPAAIILSTALPREGAAVLLKALRQNPMYWHVPVLSAVPPCAVGEDLPLLLDTDDFLCKAHPQADLRRRIDRMVSMASCQSTECALRDEANRDYQTGLLNRRGLQAAMATLRKEEMPLSVCVFDLDDLKTANDTGGHNAGDRLICLFAELLRSCTRSGDILCRYGGDEFVVIFKHMRDEVDAEKKGVEICSRFRELGVTSASCSGGIAFCGSEESFSPQMIDRADQALYLAKREKKGGCCLWKAEK